MKIKTKKENWFLVFLIAVFLISGLVVIFSTKKPVVQVKDVQTQRLEIQEKSDETASIEKDLKDTDFSELDKELEDIETELKNE